MALPRPRPRARDSSDADKSFGDDDQVSIKSRAPIQPIPESEAEALAYGEALPTGSQLAETRTLWWRQTALGHRLPAETNIIVMEGGRS